MEFEKGLGLFRFSFVVSYVMLWVTYAHNELPTSDLVVGEADHKLGHLVVRI